MFINRSTLIFLSMALLSLCDLSPINDNNNQHRTQITNTPVTQPTIPTKLSTISTNIKWIKRLKNITANGGQTVVLECQVKSFYPVSFNWYRYNNQLDPKHFTIEQTSLRSSIRLKYLKESQAGFYTCQASNGFQMLTSTGFVRVQNLDIEPIDLADDLLPSIDFQPEIISNHDESIDKFKCEKYTGNICRSIIDSNYISISSLDQKEIEQNLIDNMQFLSNECRQLLLPMICLFVYPLCDNHLLHSRSICRKSCYYFQNHVCMKGASYQQQFYSNFQVSHHMPTCQNLPPSSDDTSCVQIDQHRNVSSSSSTDVLSTLERLLSIDSLVIVFLSIFLPAASICLLLLFFYCRRHHPHSQNNTSNSSSYSSALTPIKKSCQFLHPIPLSPFHSAINIVPNRHNITPSSSSSNTNSTNIHYRQIFLKKEGKHRQKYLSFGSHSLCEIASINIRFIQEIGEGDFGLIYIGELIHSTTKCLIKTLQNENVKQDYLREIETVRQLDHMNISCLVGICSQPENALSLMIYEYLNNGDLHEYLLRQRSKTIDLADFLYISLQIVSGMIYLSEKKVLHNDLSTKNILLSEHMDVKITNIARYRRKYHLDYYKLANRLLPVRWMSSESLLSGMYSEMSDVWSFGVLLWEMFSYGVQPYCGHTNPEVIELIRDRKLLTCPMSCPKRIYAIMCSCWEKNIEQRPTFIELMTRLRQFEEKSTTPSSVDDELISPNQTDYSTATHITLTTADEQTVTQPILIGRNGIRFEA